MQLGNKLRRARFENDELTQADLAAAVGVTRQTIISIEKGNYVPSVLLALKIARFLQKPFEELFFIMEDDGKIHSMPKQERSTP
jgi:putative transcriptional regulator